jgi:NAD-dependent DNA ligase
MQNIDMSQIEPLFFKDFALQLQKVIFTRHLVGVHGEIESLRIDFLARNSAQQKQATFTGEEYASYLLAAAAQDGLSLRCCHCNRKLEARAAEGNGKHDSLYCPNTQCSGRLESRIIRFISNDGVGLPFPRLLIAPAIRYGGISTYSDLFTFSHRDAALLILISDMKKVLETSFIDKLRGGRRVGFGNFIYGLSVPHVGPGLTKKLDGNGIRVEDLFYKNETGMREVLQNILPERANREMSLYFSDKERVPEVKALLKHLSVY